MWRKSLYLLMLFLLAEWLVSCCDCEDYRPGIGYTMCTLDVTPLDNRGAYPIKADTLHVPLEAFGLRLRMNVFDGYCALPHNHSLMSSAFAVSCECPPRLFMESYPDSIKIISQNHLTLSHPAGSEVSELFRVLHRGRLLPVLTALSQESGPYIGTSVGQGEIKLDALLFESPLPGLHQFEVQLYLRNKEPMIVMTPELIFE